MSDAINEQDATTRKSELHADATPKQWRFEDFASTQTALDFINEAPPQVAGEISATARNDGSVGMFYSL